MCVGLGFKPYRACELEVCLVRVGAGVPAKGPGLRASFCQALCVAGTTVFAGEPAPTLIDDAGPAPQDRRPPPPVVGAGSPAKGPGLRADFCQALCVAGTTVFAGEPAPTSINDAGPGPQDYRPPPPVVIDGLAPAEASQCHGGVRRSQRKRGRDHRSMMPARPRRTTGAPHVVIDGLAPAEASQCHGGVRRSQRQRGRDHEKA
ncbi:hypothetical protein GEV39_13820 [Pseudomonas sp. NY5710]|nr:hypothetical protein GEV39_13820 [Pseudomonas sp. NY5710]